MTLEMTNTSAPIDTLPLVSIDTHPHTELHAKPIEQPIVSGLASLVTQVNSGKIINQRLIILI